MDYLKEVLNICKNSVTLTVNKHRDYYESVEYALDEDTDWYDDISDDVRAKMIELDTIITLQFYPNGATGFYTVHGYDLDDVLKRSYEILTN